MAAGPRVRWAAVLVPGGGEEADAGAGAAARVPRRGTELARPVAGQRAARARTRLQPDGAEATQVGPQIWLYVISDKTSRNFVRRTVQATKLAR